MEQQWITDRLPTEADGDGDGDVRMVPAPHADPDDYLLVHWSYVGDAAPWQRTSCWEPHTEPAPTEPDRIASRRVVQITGGDDWLVALCNDGTLLRWAAVVGWTELPAIPQP
jgi:hypothetical protein